MNYTPDKGSLLASAITNAARLEAVAAALEELLSHVPAGSGDAEVVQALIPTAAVKRAEAALRGDPDAGDFEPTAAARKERP